MLTVREYSLDIRVVEIHQLFIWSVREFTRFVWIVEQLFLQTCSFHSLASFSNFSYVKLYFTKTCSFHSLVTWSYTSLKPACYTRLLRSFHSLKPVCFQKFIGREEDKIRSTNVRLHALVLYFVYILANRKWNVVTSVMWSYAWLKPIRYTHSQALATSVTFGYTSLKPAHFLRSQALAYTK